jgi:Cu-Zn family superoxide dismutase
MAMRANGLVRLALAVGLAGFGAATAGAQKPGEPWPHEITVKLNNGIHEYVGTATFKTVPKGLKITVELEHMPPGLHGVHIHQNAVCTTPDFKSAGGHFNPDMKMHGYKNPAGPHNGDFPNSIKVGENGKGEFTFITDRLSLNPNVPESLFHGGGTAIVVHEKLDDEMTDPSGDSGARIACGVIQ